MDLLVLAYDLSLLTFVLGAMIYGIPIPIRGLKRWGPRLIADSIMVSILVSFFTVIKGFADYILSLLGGDWSTFIAFMYLDVTTRISAILTVSSISMYFKMLGIAPLTRVLGMIVSKLTWSTYMALILFFYALFIKYSHTTLMILGILFMAIPFRIARNVGAFLYSLALVSYVMLPLYPMFMSTTFRLGGISTSTIFIEGTITTYTGTSLDSGYIVLQLHGKDNSTKRLTLPVYSGKFYIDLKPDIRSIDVRAWLCGHEFYTNVSSTPINELNCRNLSSSIMVCRFKAYTQGLLYYDSGLTLHLYPHCSLISMNTSPQYVVAFLNCSERTKLFISLVSSIDLQSVFIDNKSVVVEKEYCWYWEDLQGCTYTTNIDEGIHSVAIVIERNGEVFEPTSVSTSVESFSESRNIVEALITISCSIYLYIVGALLYLIMIVSIANGLARFLGGGIRFRIV